MPVEILHAVLDVLKYPAGIRLAIRLQQQAGVATARLVAGQALHHIRIKRERLIVTTHVLEDSSAKQLHPVDVRLSRGLRKSVEQRQRLGRSIVEKQRPSEL